MMHSTDVPAPPEIYADDRASSRERMPLWSVLLLWVYVLTSMATFRDREMGDLWSSGGFDAQVKFQAISWVGLGILAVFLLGTGRADLRLVRRGPLMWFTGFACLALISASYATSPLLSAFRAIQLLIAVVLVISMREHLVRIPLLIAIYVIMNWIFCFATGEFFNRENLDTSEVWRFNSPYGHPTVIGMMSAVGLVGLVAVYWGRRWGLWVPMLLLYALTILLTVCRTAIAGVFGGAAVAVFGRGKFFATAVLFGSIIPALFISNTVQDRAIKFLSRGQTSEEVLSLTGRDVIYQEAFERAKENWVLGSGYQSARSTLIAEHEGRGMTHAHNTLLEAFSSLGIFGLIVAAMVIVSVILLAIKVVWRRRYREGTGIEWLCCSMLVPILAHFFLDRGFASEIDPIVIVFLMIAGLMSVLAIEDAEAKTDDESSENELYARSQSTEGVVPLGIGMGEVGDAGDLRTEWER